MEQDFYALVRADRGISEAVGGRIFWSMRPQDVPDLPVAVLQRVSAMEDVVFSGPLPSGEARLQADIWGRSYEAVSGVFALFRAGIHGYRGSVGHTFFQGIFMDALRDGVEGDNPPLHRISMDLRVHFLTLKGS